MYSQIVVPLDGGTFSSRAVGPALKLAAASDADVLLVACARTDAHGHDLRRYLAQLGSELPREVRHKVAVVDDIPAAIVAEVDADPGSIVCMSSVGRSHAEPFLGSVAEAVLRDVSTPLLMVGPSVDVDRFEMKGTIEVPVDGSETSQAILPIAASWAIVYHLGLRVVSVVSPDPRAPEEAGTLVETGYVRHVAEKLRGDVSRPVDFDVLHGTDPAKRIIDDAELHASMIAIATHGRTGLHRVAAGSVAMQIVHHATRPVLAYRPLDLHR
jgi:nucleotide-binding universal stress UspA family protein